MEKSIYSTVPEEQLTEFGDTEALIIFLQSNKGKFYTANQLAKECGFRSSNTQVELRKVITILIEEEKLPIIASSNGFSWATNPKQILNYIEQLEARKQGLNRRINALRGIYETLKD